MNKLFQSQYDHKIKYYNKAAMTEQFSYLDHPSHLHLFVYICDWIEATAPTCSIVEIGSGTAPILQTLKRTHRYTGIDISDEYIKICNKKWRDNERVSFIQADLEVFFDSTFQLQGDILYDGNVSFYFEREEIAKFVDKAMRRLQSKYFISMNVSDHFPLPKFSFLKLIKSKSFEIDLLSIPKFKRERTVEIYERI